MNRTCTQTNHTKHPAAEPRRIHAHGASPLPPCSVLRPPCMILGRATLCALAITSRPPPASSTMQRSKMEVLAALHADTVLPEMVIRSKE